MISNSKKFISIIASGLLTCFGTLAGSVNAEILVSDGVQVNVDANGSDKMCFYEVFESRGYDFYSKDEFVVIDIGANVGYTSLFMANKDNVTKVYAFEPFKPTFDLAMNNINMNKSISSKISLFNFGLSDTNKDIKVHYDPNATWGMSSVYDFGTGKVEDINIKKSSEVLRPIIEENKDKKIYLKVDCEGEEYNILPDLDRAGILKDIDVIALEWHWQGTKNLFEILNRNDFTFFANPNLRQGIIRAVRHI